MSREYLDFEVEIRDDGTGGYVVAVVRSPAGEVSAPMSFPFGELELQNHLQALEIALLRSGGRRRRVLTPEEETVKRFGRTLFDMLMIGEVGTLYRLSQREAFHADKGLRVKLRIQPPRLASLPWEFLYDPQSDYTCLSSSTPLVRYPEVAQPPLPLSVKPPLRILGMVASPEGLEELDVPLEKQRVETALKRLQADGLVELVWLPGQTWRELQRALRRETWHIFHFIGHGGFDAVRDEGMLMLADDVGKASPLLANQLGQLLANHRSLRLALLNACEGARGGNLDVFSSTAATLIRRGLPAVVAMQYEISDRAAIEFVQTFYESVADGLPVDTSVAEARVAMSLAVTNTLEWGTPVLYMRAPNGKIFTLTEPSSTSRPEQEQRVRQADSQSNGIESQPGSVLSSAQITTSTRRSPSVYVDWVTIPAGEFLMGSDKKQDKKAYGDELPQHRLHLPDYRIARTPVTVAQFETFVKATGYQTTAEKEGSAYVYTGSDWQNIQGANWRNPHGPGSNVNEKAQHPVTRVSWHDARAFCEWLSKELGQEIRLPTEAEWEKAARGTDGRIYPWGNDAREDRCNFNIYWDGTTPVSKYANGASPYGCLDMAGNVWEWTSSGFTPYPYEGGDGREDPNSGARRVLRGGSISYFGDRRGVRCAARFNSAPFYRYINIGFRVLSPGI
jgi:formylglycine-generating enzyme required for sulfatase activity